MAYSYKQSTVYFKLLSRLSQVSGYFRTLAFYFYTC